MLGKSEGMKGDHSENSSSSVALCLGGFTGLQLHARILTANSFVPTTLTKIAAWEQATGLKIAECVAAAGG